MRTRQLWTLQPNCVQQTPDRKNHLERQEEQPLPPPAPYRRFARICTEKTTTCRRGIKKGHKPRLTISKGRMAARVKPNCDALDKLSKPQARRNIIPSGVVRRALAGADASTAVRLLTKGGVICQHPHFYWQSRQATSHLAGK